MELFESIKGRRSVRAFQSTPIPEALLLQVLEAAQYAPSAGNCQARDFIVITDFHIKKKLCEAALGQTFIQQAPIIVVICANEQRSAKRYGKRGKALYCLLDAAASVQNLLLAVHALGLGACWVGAFHDEAVAHILDLPPWLKPIALLPIGYPNERPWSTPRRPIFDILHRNGYSTTAIDGVLHR